MSGPTIKSNAVYGDETALRRLNPQATKEANGELPVARRDVGRPTGPAYRGAPGIVPPQGQVEEASPYSDFYHAFGRAARVQQVGDQMAADPMAGPWLLEYQFRAQERAMKAGTDVRENTPYWEE